jgi:hypothetical protein
VHKAAAAYVSEKNIYENAEAHRESAAILKLDFTNFFPSIRVRDWERLVRSYAFPPVEPRDLSLYAHILFWSTKKGSTVPRCLSIGAPTSPALSNIIMYEIDKKLSDAAAEQNIVYTRYADDITLSGIDAASVVRFECLVNSVVSRSNTPVLKFNEQKRGLYVRGQRQLITGLVITPDQKVSIGRQRKRVISALIHRAKLNQLDIEGKARLKGLLGFSVANEPAFVSRMRHKYGDALIDAIFRFEIPPRNQR